MLHVVTPEEARQIIAETVTAQEKTESVSLEHALGRIAGEDILSPEDLPAFDRSTVDGYAVIAEDTYGCSESIPAMLLCDGEIQMGERVRRTLEKGHCMRIATGGSLPPGSDAVSMIEYSDDIGDEFRYIYKPVSPLENVNRQGDDIQKGSIAVEKGEAITSRSIAILSALGISRIKAVLPVRVGILSTGDELVEYAMQPQGAQIRNINSVMLAAQVKESGASPIVYPIIKDELSLLSAALEKALAECDMVLISGGSSVGEKDNTHQVLEKLGTVHFHGISIKPGKPTLYASVKGKPVFGLPGHPQAAHFTFLLFCVPCLRKLMSKKDKPVLTVRILSDNIPSNHGREEIIPVILTEQTAIPLHSKSGVVSVLTKADGYIRIPREAEGLKKGTQVSVVLF